MAKVRVSNEDFVKAILAYKSYAEVSAATGLTTASVHTRANKLRKLGVNLPTYERVKKETDVTALNALIGG
jgi:hypothetical protein